MGQDGASAMVASANENSFCNNPDTQTRVPCGGDPLRFWISVGDPVCSSLIRCDTIVPRGGGGVIRSVQRKMCKHLICTNRCLAHVPGREMLTGLRNMAKKIPCQITWGFHKEGILLNRFCTKICAYLVRPL